VKYGSLGNGSIDHLSGQIQYAFDSVGAMLPLIRSGLFVPAKTPKRAVDGLHDETIVVLSVPEVRKTLADRSINRVGNASDEFRAEISAKTAKNRELAVRIGIKAG